MGGVREFFEDGSVVKGAAGWIIAQSFTDMVFAFSGSFIMPVFGIFGGIPVFEESTFSINNSLFAFGKFIDTLIAFIIVGFVLYICVILPFSILSKKLKKGKAYDKRECPRCFCEVPKKASRCYFCTSEIEAVWSADQEEDESDSENGGKFSLAKCCYTVVETALDNRSDGSAQENNHESLKCSACPTPKGNFKWSFGCPCIKFKNKAKDRTSTRSSGSHRLSLPTKADTTAAVAPQFENDVVAVKNLEEVSNTESSPDSMV